MKTTDTFTYVSAFGTEFPNCHFSVGQYFNDNNALFIVDDDGRVVTCSVNGYRINKSDEIGIKNWSENEGVVEFLTKMGIIGEKVAEEPSGFVTIPYFKLTESGKELFA